MARGSVAIVRGPADEIDCDAWLEPVGRTGLRAGTELDRFHNPEFAINQGRKLASATVRPSATALKGRTERDPLRVLTVADLVPRGDNVPPLVRAFSAAIRAGVERSALMGRDPGPSGIRLAIPCPSTTGWFPPSNLARAARDVMHAAHQAAENLKSELILIIDDEAVYRALQTERAYTPHFWWPALGSEPFDLLVEAAEDMRRGRVTAFTGEAVSRRESGPRSIGRGLFGPAAALVASMQAGWVGNLGADEELAAAWRGCGGSLDANRMLSLGARDAALVKDSPRQAPDEAAWRNRVALALPRESGRRFLFLGVRPASSSLLKLLETIADVHGSATTAPGLMVLDASIPGDRAPSWAAHFATITATAESRHQRDQAFVMILDTLAALRATERVGAYRETRRRQQWPEQGSTRRRGWLVVNGGSPGSGRR